MGGWVSSAFSRAPPASGESSWSVGLVGGRMWCAPSCSGVHCEVAAAQGAVEGGPSGHRGQGREGLS